MDYLALNIHLDKCMSMNSGGGRRKLHNEELHNLYTPPSIIRVIKSRRMRWTGHVARMGKRGIHI
jgi:hypothetical protein